MNKLFVTAILCVGFMLSGCYNATIETGKAPSGEVIEQPFALSFVYGLVPPPTVNAAEQCPNGVSKVETKLSFVNGLVANLTFGLFTPMTIEVTCAAASAMGPEMDRSRNSLTLDKGASQTEAQSTYMKAADMAVNNGDAVYISHK